MIARPTFFQNMYRHMMPFAAAAAIMIAHSAINAQSPVPAAGAGPATATALPVYLKFTNSATGAAVTPSALLISGAPASFTVEAGSFVVLNLPEGPHKLEIQAEGYDRLESAVTVAAGATPVMSFELDPQTTATIAQVPEGTAILEGHVTDADTGRLLEQVQISLPDAALTTTTDFSGRFEFQVLVPKPAEAAQPVVILEARADGYVPVHMKNLILASGQRRRMPIALERKTSDNLPETIYETDEAADSGRHRSFEWVYDVTLR